MRVPLSSIYFFKPTKIIGWGPPIWDYSPVWEILDPPLEKDMLNSRTLIQYHVPIRTNVYEFVGQN